MVTPSQETVGRQERVPEKEKIKEEPTQERKSRQRLPGPVLLRTCHPMHAGRRKEVGVIWGRANIGFLNMT